MADKTPITVALYGFEEELEPIMQSAFANADHWTTPWILTKQLEEARVIIVDLHSEANHEIILKLKRDLPKAEIIAFSAKKSAHAKWHLVRQPTGKVSIVGFSQLVLKISHSLKRKPEEVSESVAEAIAPEESPNSKTELEEQASIKTEPELISSPYEEEDLSQESSDFLPFFNTLDSLLDSKPNEKRKRFNEQK